MNNTYMALPLKKRLELWKNWRDGTGEFSTCRYSEPPHKRGIHPHDQKWGGEPWNIEGTSTWGRFHENPKSVFEFEEYCDRIIDGIRHTGWYVDSFQDEITRGAVFRVKGKRAWIAACTDPWNDRGPVIVKVKQNGSPYLYDSSEEAARSADGFAETYAEFCREDDAKQLAKRDIEEAQEEIARLRTTIRELVGDMRTDPGEAKVPDSICRELWTSIRRYRHDMHDEWKKIQKRKDDFWSAVPH